MSKLSLGDYAVNSESFANQVAGGLSFEELKKRSEQNEISKESIAKKSLVQSIVLV